MNPLRPLISLFRRKKFNADMAEEMRLHLEMQVEQNVAAGMSPEEARYAAQREFGNVASLQERAREQRAGGFGVWAEQLGQDLRYAVRQVRRSPGFSAAVVLTLALGIWANTAVFSIVDALLLKPLPVRDAAGVWSMEFLDQNGQMTWFGLSSPLLRMYRDASKSVTGISGSAVIGVTSAGHDRRHRLTGELVTGDYFPMLGVRPVLGRLITPSDDQVPERSAVAVISYEFWQSRYGGMADILGHPLRANNVNLTIIGVAPVGFSGVQNRAAFARPAFWAPASLEKTIGENSQYHLAGRLQPGMSREQAEAELNTITAGIIAHSKGTPPIGFEQYGTLPEGWHVFLMRTALGVVGMEYGGRGQVAVLVVLFFGAAALVLLVACANAANLLLARAFARRREIAVRLVLGAGKGRLVRQLLIESLLLAMLSAVFGLLLAEWGIAALTTMRTGILQYLPLDAVHLDRRVLGFTTGLAILTGIVFGLAPAWQAMPRQLGTALKSDVGSTVGLRRGRLTLRNGLVVAQVSACLVLLVGAGLCLRSYGRLTDVDPGFVARNLHVATVSFDEDRYTDETALAQVEQLVGRLQVQPGISACALADQSIPLSGQSARQATDHLDGYAPRPKEVIIYIINRVGPGYFRTLGIPLGQGREFNAHDRGSAGVQVAVVNQAFANRYWPGQNPMGKHIMGAEVVGVAHDARLMQIYQTPEPQVFFARLQGVDVVFQGEGRAFTIYLQSDQRADLITAQLLRELKGLDANAEVLKTDTMEHILHVSLSGQRSMMRVLAIFGGCALLLAVIGLYGVMAYAVTQRTKEIGVRMALGAGAGEVASLILRHGLLLVGIGLGIGLLLAIGTTRLLQSWLYGISATDAVTYAGASLLLGVVAALACWVPARRATKIDPAITLRSE